jgi:hypothetical protein
MPLHTHPVTRRAFQNPARARRIAGPFDAVPGVALNHLKKTNMKKNLLIALGLVVCAQAQAHNNPGCSPNAANGKWIMYQGAVSDGFQHTGRCELTLKDGAATGRCVMTNGLDVPVNGPVSVSKSCAVSLELGFDVPKGPHIDSFFDLQLTKDKQSFAGQFSNTFNVVGLSNGVKR